MESDKDKKTQENADRLEPNKLTPNATGNNPLEAPELVVPDDAKTQAENARRLKKTMKIRVAQEIDRLSESDAKNVNRELLDPAATQRFLAFLSDAKTYEDFRRIAEWEAKGNRKISASSVALSVWTSLYENLANIRYNSENVATPFSTRDDFLRYCRIAIYRKICKRLQKVAPINFSDLEQNSSDDEEFVIDFPDRQHNDKPEIVVDIRNVYVENEIDVYHGNFNDSIWARRFFVMSCYLKQTAKEIAEKYSGMGWGVVTPQQIARICRRFHLAILRNFLDQTPKDSQPKRNDLPILFLRYVEQKKPERIEREDHFDLETVKKSLWRIKETTDEYNLSFYYSDADLDADLDAFN